MSKRTNIENIEARAAPNELARWKADTGLTGTVTCEVCKVTMPIAEFTSRRYHRSSWSHKQCLHCWDKARTAARLADALEIANALRNVSLRRKKIKEVYLLLHCLFQSWVIQYLELVE